MDFILNHPNILFKVAVINYIMLAISQVIVFPLLGYKIYNSCKAIGYAMKSRPAFAMFNFSRLWSEAREFNRKANDELIRRALRTYRYFIGYMIFSFLFVVIAAAINNS